HAFFVEGIDLGRLPGSTGRHDVLDDRFDRSPQAPGEKDLGPLARKGACHRAADGASGPVDHRNFVLQHHLHYLRRLRIVRAADNADTASSRNWAPHHRPVRCWTGVHPGSTMETQYDARRADATVRAMTADWIAGARAGDGEAFRKLTEPHH